MSIDSIGSQRSGASLSGVDPTSEASTTPRSVTSTISSADSGESLGCPLEWMGRISRLFTQICTFFTHLFSCLFPHSSPADEVAPTGPTTHPSTDLPPSVSPASGLPPVAEATSLRSPSGPGLADVLSAPNLREGLHRLRASAERSTSFAELDDTLRHLDLRIEGALRAQMQRVMGLETVRLRMAIGSLNGILRVLEELAGIRPATEGDTRAWPLAEDALGTLQRLSEDDFLGLGVLKERVINYVVTTIAPERMGRSLEENMQMIVGSDNQAQIRLSIRRFFEEIMASLPIEAPQGAVAAAVGVSDPALGALFSEDARIRAYQEELAAIPGQKERLARLGEILRSIEGSDAQLEAFLPLFSENVRGLIREGLTRISANGVTPMRFYEIVEALAFDAQRCHTLLEMRQVPASSNDRQHRQQVQQWNRTFGQLSGFGQEKIGLYLRRFQTTLHGNPLMPRQFMLTNQFHVHTREALQLYYNSICVV